MQEITNKKFFINYAFFTLFLIVVFGILAYFSIASKKSFSKNLAVSVQKVLDEYNPDFVLLNKCNMSKKSRLNMTG